MFEASAHPATYWQPQEQKLFHFDTPHVCALSHTRTLARLWAGTLRCSSQRQFMCSAVISNNMSYTVYFSSANNSILSRRIKLPYEPEEMKICVHEMLTLRHCSAHTPPNTDFKYIWLLHSEPYCHRAQPVHPSYFLFYLIFLLHTRQYIRLSRPPRQPHE